VYQVNYHPQALKQLKRLPRIDQIKITQAVCWLQKGPFAAGLDVRRFHRTQKSYRIRAGNLRAIYEINPSTKEIYIRYLGYRGQIY
jgi:mRNA-degrading endonuclease RelE of RelBE toxin-antitoxin system